MLDALLSTLPAAQLATAQVTDLPSVSPVLSAQRPVEPVSAAGLQPAVSIPESIPLPAASRSAPVPAAKPPLPAPVPAVKPPIPSQVAPKASAASGTAIAPPQNRATRRASTQRTRSRKTQTGARKTSGSRSRLIVQNAALTPASASSQATPPLGTSAPAATPPQGTSTSTSLNAAQAERLKLLEQKLADIVAREKPLKEERLRQNLKATAIKQAEAGQIEAARETARDLVLPLETQAELLTQINAIAANRKQPPTLAKTTPTKPAALTHLSRQTAANTAGTTSPYVPSYVLPGTLQPPSFPSLGSNFRLVQPAWRLGNGNLRLIFPLPIPAFFSSGFGWRTHPVTGDRRFHRGVDLAAPMGTPVVAAFSGKVVTADWMDGYGLTVILAHKESTQTLYAHLSEVFVKPGDTVIQGAPIGRVGSTGLSTGPHLHFELHQLTADGWEAFDPAVALEVAMTHLAKVMQLPGQLPALTAGPSQPQFPALPQPFAAIPPPPTQKFSILHNF